MKNGFMIYCSQYESVKSLSLEDKGRLFDAIYLYNLNPENPVGFDNPLLTMAFSFYKNQFDIDKDKYEKKANASRNNGNLGGRPRREENLPGLMKPVKDNDKVKDKDNDIEKPTGFLDMSPEGFKEFWESYPKPIKLPLAISSFTHALRKTSLENILEGVRKYKKDCKAKGTEEKYIASPNDWLDQERRNDVYKTASTPKQEQPTAVITMTDEQRQAAREKLAETRKSLGNKFAS